MSCMRLRAQSFQWAHTAGPTCEYNNISHTAPGEVFTDSKDNVYFCFDFEGTTELTIAGERVFMPVGMEGTKCAGVACYDCQGTLQWYRLFYGKSKWSRPDLSRFNTAAMVDDTLVLWFFGYFDTLLVCDSARVLDTVVCNPTEALWLNTGNGRPIRTAHTGIPRHVHYYNNRLHVLGYCSVDEVIPGMMDDSCYVQLFTPQGEKVRHLSLDFTTSYPEVTQMQFAVYHDKYYFVNSMSTVDSCQFGSRRYVGRDTLYLNTVFACFDDSGRCLWSRLLNSDLLRFYKTSRMAVDTSAGRIYLVGEGAAYLLYGDNLHTVFDGDTLWDDENSRYITILACYDTLGNKLWQKYSRGPGRLQGGHIEMLPDHKLVIGGQATQGDAFFEGFHTRVPSDALATASFFTIYDCVKDSFELMQVNPRLQWVTPPMHFATDRNGNLYFSSQLAIHDYVVLGSDTIYSIGSANTIVYGRYGWGCDTVAHWPGAPHYTLSLNVGQADMGTVSGAGTYPGGARVPIAATPFPGHSFDRWGDGSTLNPRTIFLASDSSLTAHFTKDQSEPEGVSPADSPHLSLYPNPATGRVQILGLTGEAPYVEIYDMTGRTAATFHHTSSLDISHLPPAPYIVKIQTADGSHHLKLMKK